MDDKRLHFMQEAIRLAEENVAGDDGGPFGAVVVKDGEIIARGANLVTSSCDPTAHAEVVAIREACRVLGSFQLTDCEIYASCEPCPMCLGAIYWARPARLFFASTRGDAASVGFDDSFIYNEVPLPPEARSLPTEHLVHADQMKPFEAWNAKTDRTDY